MPIVKFFQSLFSFYFGGSCFESHSVETILMGAFFPGFQENSDRTSYYVEKLFAAYDFYLDLYLRNIKGKR